MIKPQLILITGYAGSGKDYLGHQFINGIPAIGADHNEYNITKINSSCSEVNMSSMHIRLAFADKPKAMFMHALDTTNIQYDDNQLVERFNLIKDTYNKDTNTTMRNMLIDYTTKYRNIHGKNVYTRILIDIIQQHHMNHNIVITDWRLPEEYDLIYDAFNKTHTILCIYVSRKGQECPQYMMEGLISPSECDYIFEWSHQ